MLENFAIPNLENRQPNIIFQLHSAPSHWSHFFRDRLDENFSNRWIGRGEPIPWPPRSQGITPCGFFGKGFLKDGVYANKVNSME